jgi:gluconolactonase
MTATEAQKRRILLVQAWAMGCSALLGAPAMAQPASAPAAAAQTAIPVLDKAQIDALLAAPDKVLFLDVRRADEISTIGGLPVFLNIQASELDRFLAYIPRDRQVVTISNHAHRAEAAGAVLAARGFRVIGAIGVQDYEAQGGKLSGRKLIAPIIAGVTKADTRIEVIREGFDGTEGPIALQDGSILFTENRADRIVKIAPDNAVSTYLEKTGGANALALKADGQLLAVQTAPSGIAALQPAAKVLASKYQGKPLNRPNDLAVSRAGFVYFTDPGAAPQAGAPAVQTAVYWLDKKGATHPIANDIRRPNGIALSPDEKTLYVANTGGDHLIAFTIQPDGSTTARHDFATLAGLRDTPTGPSSGADGIVVDADGRVYVATTAGVQIFSPEGQAIGVIPLPNAPQNLAFGGADRTKLYVVGRGSVYRIATLTRGVDRPGK